MDNDLVKWSFRFSSVASRFIFTYFILLIYQIKWSFLSTYLNHWLDFDSFAYVMTPLLSQYRATKSTMLGTNLIHW
jgi:hypothetical protein